MSQGDFYINAVFSGEKYESYGSWGIKLGFSLD